MTAITCAAHAFGLGRASEIGMRDNQTYTASDVDPVSASASQLLTLKTDGDMTLAGGTPGIDEWHVDNISAGLGNDWYVKVIEVSGTVDSGTVGSWLALTSNRSWGKNATRSTTGTTVNEVTLDFHFGTNGSSALIIIENVTLRASATVTL